MLVASVAMAFALAASACGGGPARAGVATVRPTTTTTGRSGGAPAVGGPTAREFVRYALCMRSHGVLNFPEDPSSPAFLAMKRGGEMSTPQFQAAGRACQKYSVNHGTPPPPITARDQADYLRAATCMRNHGITGFADPVFSGGNVNIPIPHSINTNSAPFRRASEICKRLIPAGLPYSSEGESG